MTTEIDTHARAVIHDYEEAQRAAARADAEERLALQGNYPREADRGNGEPKEAPIQHFSGDTFADLALPVREVLATNDEGEPLLRRRMR